VGRVGNIPPLQNVLSSGVHTRRRLGLTFRPGVGCLVQWEARMQIRTAMLVTAGCIFSFSATAGWASEPIAPVVGTYVANVYIQTATGDGCMDTPGRAFAGVLVYGGLSATQFWLRLPQTGSTTGIVSTEVLTITAGAGTTSPSGKFTWKGQGVGPAWNLNGTFTASITGIDTHSFVMNLSERYANSGYYCTETPVVAATRVGAKQ